MIEWINKSKTTGYIQINGIINKKVIYQIIYNTSLCVYKLLEYKYINDNFLMVEEICFKRTDFQSHNDKIITKELKNKARNLERMKVITKLLKN